MKIGNRIVVKESSWLPKEMVGQTGTIIRKHTPDSQVGMLSDVSRWDIQFDEPVRICGVPFDVCGNFSENDLALATN